MSKRMAKRFKADTDAPHESSGAVNDVVRGADGEAERLASTSDCSESDGRGKCEGVSSSSGLSTMAAVASAAFASLPATSSPSSSVARMPTSAELQEHGPHMEGIIEKSKHDKKWNEMFMRLQRYKTKNETTNVKQDNGKLGRWVHYQRVEHGLYQQHPKRAKITQERVDKLDNISFEWDPQKTQWEVMFNLLETFKNTHGHCNVNKSYHDRKLANWVRNQRLEYSNLIRGKKSRMTEDRKNRLDQLSFKWTSSPEESGTSESQSEPN